MSFNIVDGPFLADSALSFDSTTPDVAKGASVPGDGYAIPGDFSVTAIFQHPQLLTPIGALTDVPLMCVSGVNAAADISVKLTDFSTDVDDDNILTAVVTMGATTHTRTFNFGFEGSPVGSFGTLNLHFGLMTLTKAANAYHLFIGGMEGAEGVMALTTPATFGSRGIFLGSDARGDYIVSKWADVWVHGKALTLADHQALLADLEDNDGANVLPTS